jgi:hypothetical protein
MVRTLRSLFDGWLLQTVLIFHGRVPHSPLLCAFCAPVVPTGTSGFVRTFSALLVPVRISINPFFSSPSGR